MQTFHPKETDAISRILWNYERYIEFFHPAASGSQRSGFSMNVNFDFQAPAQVKSFEWQHIWMTRSRWGCSVSKNLPTMPHIAICFDSYLSREHASKHLKKCHSCYSDKVMCPFCRLVRSNAGQLTSHTDSTRWRSMLRLREFLQTIEASRLLWPGVSGRNSKFWVSKSFLLFYNAFK